MPEKTSNYQLNQWKPEDDFLRTDFNEDNAKLEAALSGLRQVADGKAAQSALDGLSTTVSTKADQSALDALSTTVSTKAAQSDLTRLSSQVSALSTTVSQKANKSTVTSLTSTVNGKVEVYLGSYDGDASTEREFTVGFQPKAVSIWNRNGMQGVANGVYGGFMAPGMPIIFHGNNNYDYVCAEVTSTGFKLYNANVNATNGQNLINNTNEHYYYMVFK